VQYCIIAWILRISEQHLQSLSNKTLNERTLGLMTRTMSVAWGETWQWLTPLRDEGDGIYMYVSSSFDLPLTSFDYLLTLSSIDLILMSSCKGPLSSFRSRNVEFGIEFGFELRFERRIKQGHLLQYNIISLTSWQSVTVEWRGRLLVRWVRTWYVLRLHRSDGSDNGLAFV